MEVKKVNRILIGNSNNKIGVIKQDTIIIDIKENGQVIDREVTYNEYLGIE